MRLRAEPERDPRQSRTGQQRRWDRGRPPEDHQHAHGDDRGGDQGPQEHGDGVRALHRPLLAQAEAGDAGGGAARDRLAGQEVAAAGGVAVLGRRRDLLDPPLEVADRRERDAAQQPPAEDDQGDDDEVADEAVDEAGDPADVDDVVDPQTDLAGALARLLGSGGNGLALHAAPRVEPGPGRIGGPGLRHAMICA